MSLLLRSLIPYEVNGMLKMNVKDMTSQIEKDTKPKLDSDVDASYIKGIFDAIRYVGGDLNEAFEKQHGLSPVNTNEILQTIRTFSNSLHKPAEDTQIHLDLLTHQEKLFNNSKELRNYRTEVLEKRNEISILKNELERKNIMLSMRENEIRQLSSDASWMADSNWNNADRLRDELRETRGKLDEKTAEVNMMRKELEQRNICLSAMKNKINQFP